MHYRKKPGETRTFAVNLTHKLHGAELLSGTPTVAERYTTALTITAVALNADSRWISGRTALAGQAVEFTVAGGVLGSTYIVRVTAGTDSSPAQVLIEDVRIEIA